MLSFILLTVLRRRSPLREPAVKVDFAAKAETDVKAKPTARAELAVKKKLTMKAVSVRAAGSCSWAHTRCRNPLRERDRMQPFQAAEGEPAASAGCEGGVRCIGRD